MNIIAKMALKLLKDRRKRDEFIVVDEDMQQALSFLGELMWDEFHRNNGVLNKDIHIIREELAEWLPISSVRYIYKHMGEYNG